MCGIAGAVGLKDISQDLFEGIRNLEYRGYDSCGVAFMNRQSIVVKKNVGYVAPEATSHRRSVPSADADRSLDPSSRYSSECTQSVCPLRILGLASATRSHTPTLPSRRPRATWSPPGLKLISVDMSASPVGPTSIDITS